MDQVKLNSLQCMFCTRHFAGGSVIFIEIEEECFFYVQQKLTAIHSVEGAIFYELGVNS